MKCAASYTIAIIKDGENGKGIVSITRYWGISNSMTTPPSSFSETKPERSEGEFLWAKDITKYTDNTTTETVPFVVTGDTGDEAKMLLLSSDYPSFTISSSGEVSPDEITVNVKKSGISDSTEFSVSNGMAIANDSSEIKITPYMAGLSKIKLTNLATEPIDNTNSLYVFFPPYWDDTRSYDSDTHTITFTNLLAQGSFVGICNMRISLAQFEEIKQKGFVGIIILDEFETTGKNLVLNIFFERRYIKGDGSYGYWSNIAVPIDKTLENGKTFVFYLIGESFDKTYSDFAHWDEDVDYYTLMVRIQGTKAGDTISIKARDLRIIPLPVNLEEAFPYFASLEYADKVEVLKTIPYFTGEMVLGNKLTNLLQYDHMYRVRYKQTGAPYNEETHEWLFDFGAIENPSDGQSYYVKGKDALYEHYSFTSFEASFIAGSALSEDAKFFRLGSIESSVLIAGDNTKLIEANTLTEDYKKYTMFESCKSSVVTLSHYIFSYIHPLATPISKFLDSTLKIKNLVGIDLSATGWYTFFKLMGATDQAIYDWCNSLPFFENSYEVPVEPIKITATAGEYKDSIVISCTDIQPVSFEINVSPNTYPMTSRQYVASPSILTLACNKKNYNLSNQAVWTIAANDYIYFSNDSGTKIEGTTYTGDNAFITIAKGCTTVAFKIACSLEGLGTREFTVSGAYPDFTPAYLGTVDATLGQSFPTVVEGKGPIMVGDMVVYITEDAQGNKTSEYYVCTSVNENGVGTWVKYIADTHHNSELMISGIYDAIMSGSKNASMLAMVEQLVAQYIAAEYIRITGAIYGGSYNRDGSVEIDSSTGKQGKGFYLDKNGSAKMNNSEINGSFTASDDDGIIMQTKKTAVSKPYTESNIDRYLTAYYWAKNDYTYPTAYIQNQGSKSFYFRKSSNNNNHIMDFEYFEGLISTDDTPLAYSEKNICGKPIIAWSEYYQTNGGTFNKTVTVKGDLSNVEVYCYVKASWVDSYPPDSVSQRLPSLKVNGTEVLDTNPNYYINVGTDYFGNKVSFVNKLNVKENDVLTIKVPNSLNTLIYTLGIVYLSKYRMPYCKLIFPNEEFSNVVEYMMRPADGELRVKIEDFTSFNPIYKLLTGDNFQIANGGCFVRITDSDLHVYNNSGTDLGSVTSPTQAMCDLGIVYTSLYNMLSDLSEGEYNTNEDTSYFKINNSYDFTDISKISVSNADDNGKSIVIYGHNSKNKPTEITSGTFTLRPGLRGSTVALSMSAIFSLQILSQLRGLYVAALLPSRENNDNVVDIGMTTDHFDNAYIDNVHGNVNSEGTTNKVWGAVAN